MEPSATEGEAMHNDKSIRITAFLKSIIESGASTARWAEMAEHAERIHAGMVESSSSFPPSASGASSLASGAFSGAPSGAGSVTVPAPPLDGPVERRWVKATSSKTGKHVALLLGSHDGREDWWNAFDEVADMCRTFAKHAHIEVQLEVTKTGMKKITAARLAPRGSHEPMA